MLTVEDNKKFDWKSISMADCLKGNALDTFYTGKVFYHLLGELRKKGLEKLYEKLISPASLVFRDLEYEGLLVDTNKLKELKEQIRNKINELAEKLNSADGVPEGANFNSDRDLIKILYSLDKNKETKEWDILENVGFGLYPFAMTDKGQPKTDDENMVLMKEMIEQEYVRRGLNEKQV